MGYADHLTIHEDVPARFTAKEFIALCQREPIASWAGKVELVDGIITRMAPAHIPHWNIQRVLFLRLHEALTGNDNGWFVGQEPSVRLVGDTIRQPDVAILRDVGPLSDFFDRSALVLAVEVADSSLSIDLGAKKASYAEAFVPNYWVVDINNRRVFVMNGPRAGRYEISTPVEFGEPLTIPGTARTIILD